MRALLMLAMLVLAAPASAAAGDWNFRVMLDDREIGRHRYQLVPRDDGLELRSEARFDVRLWFVSAYRYQHEAVEHWQGGRLRDTRSRTDTNGNASRCRRREQDGHLAVERPAGQTCTPAAS